MTRQDKGAQRTHSKNENKVWGNRTEFSKRQIVVLKDQPQI